MPKSTFYTFYQKLFNFSSVQTIQVSKMLVLCIDCHIISKSKYFSNIYKGIMEQLTY